MTKGKDQPLVMVIDDVADNLSFLDALLVKLKYRVLTFENGEPALKSAAESHPDVVLLDVNMPDMDGFQVCERFKASPALKDIPIIFISGSNETIDKVKAFSVGGADYISKPYQVDEVRARLETHIKISMQRKELTNHSHHLEKLVQSQTHEISRSQAAAIAGLAKLAESRDDDTGQHIERVKLYCQTLATALTHKSPYREEISEAFIDVLLLACPIHDIGKIAIADNILLKPDKLTAEEFEVMKTHTVIGARTLATIHAKYPKNSYIRAGLTIARSHHERWDGTGYPDGAKGEESPLYARIMAVADVYDALRSIKCYRKAMTHKEAYKEIINEAGRQFDPHIIAAFEEVADQFERISNEKADEVN